MGGVANAADLPDGRAYELVSPSQKVGDVNTNQNGVIQPLAADGGDAFLFFAPAMLPGGTTNGRANDFRSTRSPSGWVTEDMAPPPSEDTSSSSEKLSVRFDVSADARRVVYGSTQPLDPADTDNEAFGFSNDDAYLRNPGGTFTWLSTGPADPNAPFNGVSWGNMSADGSRVVFDMTSPLLAEDTDGAGPDRLYEWHDGSLALVNRDTNGNVLSASSLSYQPVPNAVSPDNSHVFFVWSGKVYVYEDGGAKPLVPSATASDEQFLGATPDGSVAFFTTAEALTLDDVDSGVDLYAWHASDGSLTRISRGTGQADVWPNSGIRSSDDGSRVYFVAQGAIAPGATAGGYNLYEADGGALHFIAGLGSSDLEPDVNFCGFVSNTWYVTPDGNHLLFATSNALTSDDHDTKLDLFEYSTEAQELVRVSQGPAGGNRELATGFPETTHGCTKPEVEAQRVMSDDGRFVFFDTPESLVVQDTNTSFDVYEHDLQSGTTTLLSSGGDNGDSLLLDSSASGRDVFFSTYDRLVPQDTDTFSDIYDVRVGGGFPVPPASAPCSGDACQGPAHQPAPDLQPPGSATVNSSGVEPPPPTVKHVTVAVRRLKAGQIRHLERTGRIALRIKASATGHVTVRARAAIRGKLHTVAHRHVVARAGVVTTVHLRLTHNARKALRRHHRLTVRFSIAPARGKAKHVVLRLHRVHAGRHTSHSSGAQR